MSFCHLHLHSHYSLLDGANRLEDVIQKASRMEMPALALTDHGNLFGAVQFHDLAVKHGIKPIIGCEVYVAKDDRRSKQGRSSRSNHLILLASNPTGYQNLVRLVSLGYLEGFYYRPRIDKDLLSQYSDGLVCLSACLQGKVAQHLNADDYQRAKREAGEMAEIFGPGNYYLELQNHDIEDQLKVNEGIVKLARDLSLPLVATNDCHYLEKSDAHAHDVLLCIQTGKALDDPNRLKYRTQEFYFKSPDEMRELFRDYPEAIQNTLRIAEQCDFSFPKTESIFPEFVVPEDFTVDSYFEKVVQDGFTERSNLIHQLENDGRLNHSLEEYRERLNREIKIIQDLNFSAYFLIVWDFIRYAREEGIPVGPGRGSAAGSLVSYAMRITDIDPLQYDLLFERFLNPERVSPPDIDIDFCMNRRGEVIDYVTRRYGQENVSHIITFGTMAARAAIRDVGRSLNIPYADVDRIAKLVPQGPKVTLRNALDSVKELRDARSEHPRYEQLIDVASRLEGLSRHASTHAAGVVIAPKPLIELVPLFKSNKDEISTQYPMTDLERLGLLKMDFLGLTTLTVVEQALAQIQEQLGKTLDLDEVPLDDPKTLKLFCDGRTGGIFQFESSGMRDILCRLQPSRFEDLIALNALYRPGPIQGGMIDDFINRRHGRVKVTYELPQLEEILKETYGVIVYQEQVMQIANRLAGFSLGEADLLRKAMGKKKMSVMEAQRKKFLAGTDERGIDNKKAVRIFDLMEQFAGYGFNKSHSTAYAYLAYQTGYLKAHFPVQFMAALLTSEISNTDKVVQYLAEAREMGITVSPPDINTSGVHFEGSSENEIRFGLAAIKNAGEGAIQSIIRERDTNGPFTGFFEFCERLDSGLVNRRVLEALIKAGAFDSVYPKRKSLFEVLDRAIEIGHKAQRDRLSGQRGLFGDAESIPEDDDFDEIPDGGEWRDRERWGYEKETLGFFLSGHPLQKYNAEINTFTDASSSQLDENFNGREVAVAGVISSIRKIQTKKGETMAVFQLEDLEGTIEVLVWPRFYESHKELLDSEIPILVRGQCDIDARGEMKIICSELVELSSVWKEGVKKARVKIPVYDIEEKKLDRFEMLIKRYPGECNLEFELRKKDFFSIQLIPNQSILVNPIPAFVSEVESLFGKKSCILEVRRKGA